jgi:hypothetical protein
MIMDEVGRTVTERQESGIPKIVVYAVGIVI